MIHVHSSTTDMTQVMHVVTVYASRKMLSPILIFMGATNAFIATHECIMFPDHGHYTCQKKAWVDKGMMNRLIDLVIIL